MEFERNGNLNDDPFIQFNYNIEDRVSTLIDVVTRMAKDYVTENVLLTVGCDFSHYVRSQFSSTKIM